MAAQELRFVPDKQNTMRIPHEKWEEHKSEITELYQSNTLTEVMSHMEERFGFKATRRQYVHRLGTIWGLKKYGKTSRELTSMVESREHHEVSAEPSSHEGPGPGSRDEDLQVQNPLIVPAEATPPPYSYINHTHRVSPELFMGLYGDRPCFSRNLLPAAIDERTGTIFEPALFRSPTFLLDTMTAERTYLYIGDLLSNVGDRSRAFQIYKALYCRHYAIRDQKPPQQSLIGRLAISSAISASTHEEAEDARVILYNSSPWLCFPASSSTPLGTAPPCDSHVTLLSGILLAHVCAILSKPRVPLEQIRIIVSGLVDENNLLSKLPKRRPGLILDVLVYSLLHYVLVRYNHGSRAGEHRHEDYDNSPLDVDHVLTQYITQLLLSSEYHGLDAAGRPIKACVLRCCEVLDVAMNGDDAETGKKMDTAPKLKDLGNVKDTLQLFCWLWIHMLVLPCSEPSWANDAEQELGIPPTQLLYIVTSMLTPAIADSGHASAFCELATPPSSAVNVPSSAPIAREKAYFLSTLPNLEILKRFLDEARALNPLLSASASPPSRLTAAHYVEHFLNSKLSVKLPPPTKSEERYTGAFVRGQPCRGRQHSAAGQPSQSCDFGAGM